MVTNRLLLTGIVLFSSMAVSHAAALDTWHQVDLPQNTGALKTVAYGNGIFVAGGSGGSIVTSANGVHWTAQNSGTTETIAKIEFVNGHFFAEAGLRFNKVLISEDGENWSSIDPLFDITFGFGEFYSTHLSDAGDAFALQKSPDLESWTDVPGYPGQNGIDFNNVFLSTSQGPGGGPTYTSPDAVVWTESTPNLELVFHVSVENELFILTGTRRVFPLSRESAVIYSADGQNWQPGGLQIPGGFPGELSNVAAGAGKYVAATRFDIFYTTTLGGAWTTVTPTFEPVDTSLPGVAFGNSRFVVVMQGAILRSNPVHGP